MKRKSKSADTPSFPLPFPLSSRGIPKKPNHWESPFAAYSFIFPVINEVQTFLPTRPPSSRRPPAPPLRTHTLCCRFHFLQTPLPTHALTRLSVCVLPPLSLEERKKGRKNRPTTRDDDRPSQQPTNPCLVRPPLAICCLSCPCSLVLASK